MWWINIESCKRVYASYSMYYLFLHLRLNLVVCRETFHCGFKSIIIDLYMCWKFKQNQNEKSLMIKLYYFRSNICSRVYCVKLKSILWDGWILLVDWWLKFNFDKISFLRSMTENGVDLFNVRKFFNHFQTLYILKFI